MAWLATWRRRLRGSPRQRGMAIAVIEGAIVAGFSAFIEVWLVPVLVEGGIGIPGYQVGWLSILPFMAMLALSPFAPRIIRALGGNKRATIATASLQAVSLTLLAPPPARPAPAGGGGGGGGAAPPPPPPPPRGGVRPRSGLTSAGWAT